MKIFVRKLNESVLFTWPDGKQIEITMLRAEGDEVYVVPDTQHAVEVLILLLGLKQEQVYQTCLA